MIDLQKRILLTLICFIFCLFSPAAEKISQIIQGNDYESLKAKFDAEILHSEEQLNKAKELEKRYPKDSRPKENRKEWEKHILLCEEQFFSVLRALFKPDETTEIDAATFDSLQTEYRKRANKIDSELVILTDLSKNYPDHDISDLISALEILREKMKNTRYSCPQHQSFCKNCISKEEPCQACGGDGKWGFWDWTCELCEGKGLICAPGKTYCPNCHGRWDEGVNCTECEEGLVPCPSHTAVCPKCGTKDGVIYGQSLEP